MLSRRPLTPEDVLPFKSVEDAQISPDGTRVAFAVGDSFKLDSKWPRSTIWTVSTAGGPPTQLTAGPRTDSMHRWSPNGRHLTFLSESAWYSNRLEFRSGRRRRDPVAIGAAGSPAAVVPQRRAPGIPFLHLERSGLRDRRRPGCLSLEGKRVTSPRAWWPASAGWPGHPTGTGCWRAVTSGAVRGCTESAWPTGQRSSLWWRQAAVSMAN